MNDIQANSKYFSIFEMDLEHLQTSNSGLFVLMVLSLHKELHLRCSLEFRIDSCYFFLRFSEILKVFSGTRRIYQGNLLRSSDNSGRIGETLSYRNHYEKQIFV